MPNLLLRFFHLADSTVSYGGVILASLLFFSGILTELTWNKAGKFVRLEEK